MDDSIQLDDRFGYLPLKFSKVYILMLASIQNRHALATDQLNQRLGICNAEQFVENLSAGLTLIRNLLLRRVHEDIEARFGVDSMTAPMSLKDEERELQHAKVETEIYMVVIAADELISRGYIEGESWCLDWLTHLRLGDDLPDHILTRIDAYAEGNLEQRRLHFSNMLVRSLPEAHKAPLVVFRLFPKAVRLAVATAFLDPSRASELRTDQQRMLPAITDCPRCHGHPLESGEKCRECGNPLWKFKWLVATD